MSKYNWQAIPEATWLAFSAAFAGLVGAFMVSAGADEYLTVAVTTFIGAGFRIVVAFLAALTSSSGTISTGTTSATPPIPPSPTGGTG